MPYLIPLAQFALVKNMSISLLVQVASTYGCAKDLYLLGDDVHLRTDKDVLIDQIREDYEKQVQLIEAGIKKHYARHCIEQKLHPPEIEDVYTDVCKVKRIG